MAQMMSDKGYDYTMLLDGDAIVGPYGVSAIPTFYVIGVDGQILMREVGGSPNMAVLVGDVIARHLAEQVAEEEAEEGAGAEAEQPGEQEKK